MRLEAAQTEGGRVNSPSFGWDRGEGNAKRRVPEGRFMGMCPPYHGMGDLPEIPVCDISSANVDKGASGQRLSGPVLVLGSVPTRFFGRRPRRRMIVLTCDPRRYWRRRPCAHHRSAGRARTEHLCTDRAAPTSKKSKRAAKEEKQQADDMVIFLPLRPDDDGQDPLRTTKCLRLGTPCHHTRPCDNEASTTAIVQDSTDDWTQ